MKLYLISENTFGPGYCGECDKLREQVGDPEQPESYACFNDTREGWASDEDPDEETCPMYCVRGTTNWETARGRC